MCDMPVMMHVLTMLGIKLTKKQEELEGSSPRSKADFDALDRAKPETDVT